MVILHNLKQKYIIESGTEIEMVVNTINSFSCEEMWQDASPIWCRPQYYEGRDFISLGSFYKWWGIRQSKG